MGEDQENTGGAGSAQDFTAAEDPFALFEAWLLEATASETNDPNGMALATADAQGLPNVRMVLLKGVDEPGHPARGFVFFTNLESAKGQELAASPQAALLFHWKSLRRQVRVRGPVTPVSAEEADLYFATRPRLSRIGAWASDQSRPAREPPRVREENCATTRPSSRSATFRDRRTGLGSD